MKYLCLLQRNIFLGNDNCAVLLKEIVGVDGMYGRHYSFLKAIACLLECLHVDPNKKDDFQN